MISWFGGGLCALLLSFNTLVAQADTLTATQVDTGETLAVFDAPDGAGWCVLWHHSVQGFEVSDCYENRGGRMVLVRAHLPDFAAGLDHIPGRGVQVSDGQGGYWIEDIDEAVPTNAYILRPGAGFVDHRINMDGTEVSLSAVAPRARVRIALIRN
ncbi:DUF1850 domain-containing protein [Falsihalocynthiibacter sp. BN13B15]|uniref:DUF1850 domain-containing protein n=1 Tax=Falsihalocynthiibacter sp. BN13B15 TaxID=3240871 RepID=UPI00350EA0F6